MASRSLPAVPFRDVMFESEICQQFVTEPVFSVFLPIFFLADGCPTLTRFLRKAGVHGSYSGRWTCLAGAGYMLDFPFTAGIEPPG